MTNQDMMIEFFADNSDEQLYEILDDAKQRANDERLPGWRRLMCEEGISAIEEEIARRGCTLTRVVTHDVDGASVEVCEKCQVHMTGEHYGGVIWGEHATSDHRCITKR